TRIEAARLNTRASIRIRAGGSSRLPVQNMPFIASSAANGIAIPPTHPVNTETPILRMKFRPSFFFLIIRPPPRSTQQGTLFPYTTLIGSSQKLAGRSALQKSAQAGSAGAFTRSEEHTSELQSRLVISYAVFCLKKKKK